MTGHLKRAEPMGEPLTDNQQQDEGLHDCARGGRCAARKTVLDDGKHVTVPAQTYRAFCDADVTRIRACLNDLPKRYVELAARIGDKTRTDGPRVSGGGGASAPIPINTGVEAFQQQIVEVVTSWEERVRDAANLADVSGNRRAGHAVKVACTVLAAHVDALLALPPDSMYRTTDIARHEHVPETADMVVHDGGWVHYNDDLGGVEAGMEILNLHHRCMARLGWTPQHQDLITPCWDCGERKLRRQDGSVGLADHIECLACRSEYLGSRLRALMVDEEQARHRKATRERRRTTAPHELETHRST